MFSVLFSAFPKRTGRITLLLCHGRPDLIFLTAKFLMIELRTSKWKSARWLKLLLLQQWGILNLPKSVPMHQPESPSAAQRNFTQRNEMQHHLLESKQVGIRRLGWGREHTWEKGDGDLGRTGFNPQFWFSVLSDDLPLRGEKKSRKKSFSLMVTVYSAAALNIKNLYYHVC